MVRLGIALLATALVIVGCGPVHPLDASSKPAGTIPWLALPPDLNPPYQVVPSPVPMPIPSGTQPCLAYQLVGGEIGSQGATGHVIASIGLVATSPTGCFLDGTPNVTLLDGAGRPLHFTQRAPYFPPQVIGPAYVAYEPVPQPHTELKYGEAGLTIDWVSQPEGCPGQLADFIAKVKVDLPDGSVTVPLPEPAPAGYACQGLGVDPFESPAMPVEATPPPPLPAVRIGVQGPATPGKPFAYVVTMTNDNQVPINLAVTCPNYEEELFADIVNGSPPLGGKHLYRLNCAPAGTLAPGASATFEMIFAVPADAGPGTYTLLFAIGFTNSLTRWDQRPVAILKAG